MFPSLLLAILLLQEGDTPLDVARREGNYEVMDVLRSAGAKVSHYCVAYTKD